MSSQVPARIRPKHIFELKQPQNLHVEFGFDLIKEFLSAYAQKQWHRAFRLFHVVLLYFNVKVNPYFQWKAFSTIPLTPANRSKLTQDFLETWPLGHYKSIIGLEYLLGNYKNAGIVQQLDSKVLDMKYATTTMYKVYADMLYDSCYLQLQFYQFKNKCQCVYDAALHDEAEALFTKMSTCLFELQKRSQYAAQNRPAVAIDIFQNVDGVCEWLLGPSLFMAEYVKSTRGLQMIDVYCENCPEDLVSLKVILGYLLSYHPNQFQSISYFFQKICLMSPGDLRVLQYVEYLEKGDSYLHNANLETFFPILTLTCDTKEIFGEQSSSCLLKGTKCMSAILALQLLINLLSYDYWKDELKPWQLLTNILRSIYESWSKCWECSSCVVVREKFPELVQQLGFWPSIFYQKIMPHQLETDDAYELCVHRAFSAYIFHYDKSFVRYVRTELMARDQKKAVAKLNFLLYVDGPFAAYHHLLRDLRSLEFKLHGGVPDPNPPPKLAFTPFKRSQSPVAKTIKKRRSGLGSASSK